MTLSFDGKSEKLVIPFDAVVAFVDPSVNFGLQYEVRKTADDDQADDGESTDAAAAAETSGVVTLDSFRKK